MHKYYYKDDNQYFVLDDTNKLYKYTCKNNIEFILNYENALEILEQDLHTDGISKIMAYDELPYKMQYALNSHDGLSWRSRSYTKLTFLLCHFANRISNFPKKLSYFL